MNDENLEHHLWDLPTPELPEAWRAQILATALREARAASSSRQSWAPFLVYLQKMFRQNPLTASAMTALWILIFAFKVGTPVDPSSKLLLAHIDPNRPIYLTSIAEEIRLAQLFQDEQGQEQKQIP